MKYNVTPFLLLAMVFAHIASSLAQETKITSTEKKPTVHKLQADIVTPALVNTCVSSAFSVAIQVRQDGEPYNGDIILSCDGAIIVSQGRNNELSNSLKEGNRVDSLLVVNGLVFVELYVVRYYLPALKIDIFSSDNITTPILSHEVPLLHDKALLVEVVKSNTERKFRVRVESHNNQEVPDALLWFQGPMTQDKPPKSYSRFITKDSQGQYTFSLPPEIQGGDLQVFSKHTNTGMVVIPLITGK